MKTQINDFHVSILETISELNAKVLAGHEVYSKTEVSKMLEGVYALIENMDVPEAEDDNETFSREEIQDGMQEIFGDWDMKVYQDIELQGDRIEVSFNDREFIRDVRGAISQQF